MTFALHASLAAAVLGVALTAHARDDTDRTADRVRAMGARLAKAKAIAVTIDAAWDVVQGSGERIEFGERRVVVLRRPNRARVDVTRRDGARRGLVFDGAQITLFDHESNVYTSVTRRGTIDAALAHLVDDLGVRFPLRELLRTDSSKQLEALAGSARRVAVEHLDGVTTDHVALRGDTTDVQLWIPREGEPLPRRVVIAYRLAAGIPGFRADLEWDLAPATPDDLFTFTPAAGSEAIPLADPRAEQRP